MKTDSAIKICMHASTVTYLCYLITRIVSGATLNQVSQACLTRMFENIYLAYYYLVQTGKTRHS